MRSKNKKEKGIALIITIMLSAIMLTTVFVASREMIDEAKNSTRIDNSLIAYYAAEAGLEDALLTYRFDKTAEINPDKCVNIDNETKVINDCAATWMPKTGTYSDNAYTDRFYKVKMWYKVHSLNDPIVLNKDDVLEISLPENSGVTFNWTQQNISAGSKMMVEITTYNTTDGSILSKNLVDTLAEVPTFTSDNGPGKAIRIKPWLVNGNGTAMTEGAALSGSVPNITISSITSSGSGNFGGPITHIESIGYYGDVQRKIVADVNRMSGQVLSIMDFVIYSGSNLIK